MNSSADYVNKVINLYLSMVDNKPTIVFQE